MRIIGPYSQPKSHGGGYALTIIKSQDISYTLSYPNEDKADEAKERIEVEGFDYNIEYKRSLAK